MRILPYRKFPQETSPRLFAHFILEPDENDTRYCQECLYDSEWCESEFQSQNNQIHNRNFQYVDINVFEYLHRFGNISIQLKIAITTVFIPLRIYKNFREIQLKRSKNRHFR